ncbi:L-type lectin-domain containing receptor kinase S.6 [Raphanus sativus]|uniref:non-specific serine/threonine protein kinase n=1 Tax=Raphanus sativus TaxID=3726 RepID=A0A6J0N0J9_RAPSA|nr:L-type lectin-domain containing receptor kinase S.6 [Raphanus sativus]KAJ4901032.1 L-type lectin-domain containing receptor kinase S.6 [Raphanus sativus]
MNPSPPFLLFFYLILLLTQDSPALSLRFSPSQPNLTLYGDAFFRGHTISLTQQQPCFPSPSPRNCSSSGIGRALYVYPIKFLEPSTNTTASFSCRFSFTIISSPSCPFGDGFAFLITSNADSLSFSNGFLGLPDPALDPHGSFVAVEFDTSFDPIHGDINDNHVGIDVNSIVSVASVDAISKGIDLKSGREMMVWIEYSDVLKLIRVWVGYSRVKPKSPVLSARIDLAGKFKEYMHVGFSASNALGSAFHIVERWKFRTFGSHPDAVQEDDDDWLVCFENPRNAHHRYGFDVRVSVVGLRIPFWSLIPGFAAVVVLTAFIAYSLIRGKKRIVCEGLNRVPGRLSLAEIKSATLGFNENTIVGHGATATVYRGSIPTVGPVAVKRFDRAHWPQCNRNPFTTEFATMTGHLRHKNLVQFQGWCSEGTETALVFEYLPNGSLSDFLHKKPSSDPSEEFIVLSWKQRVNIILGVASALNYLHEECERQIIHRDVKTCNIMLDAEFNAKLGDFGLAEVYEHSAMLAGRNATLPAGTMGYLAPEYVYKGVPSEKTDVYSFGVVILEVCTGRRPVGDDGSILIDLMWSLWEKGKVLDGVDVMLKEEFDAEEMERMLMVGMVCSHPDCEKRPRVKEAVRIIRGEAPLPVLPAKRPLLKIHMTTETEEMIADSLVGDELPWMTPKSHF